MSEHIKKLQERNNLKVNGIVNRETALFLGEKLSLDKKVLINFLGQIDAITSFQAKRETTNFSKVKLRKELPHLFDERRISIYFNKPQNIANRAYANLLGNGDEMSGDGYHFRGNGFFGFKGRDYHQEFSNFIGEDCVANPNLIIEKYLFDDAKFFFDKYKLWDSMREITIDNIVELTKKVNKALEITNREKKRVEPRIEKTLIYEKTI
jgi:putative chitinase